MSVASSTRERSVTATRRATRKSQQTVAYARRRRALEVSLGVLVPVALLGLWEVAATQGWIDKRLYPAPSRILQVGAEMLTAEDPRFRQDIYVTLRRVLVGVVAGGFLGMVVGMLLGSIRLVRAALEPTLNALYVVPKLALMPVFMTLVGLGEPSLLLIVSWTVFFYVWLYTMEAVVSIPEGYRESARALHVGRIQTIRDVIVPSVLPQLFVALRVGVNVSVIMIVAAEFLAGNSGLGYLIFDSRRIFMNEQMFVGIVAVSLLGVTLAALVTWTGRLLTPWTRTGRS
jgi:sulfonate transport system permease protein